MAHGNVFNPETMSLAAVVLGILLIALVSVGGFTVLAQRRLRSIGMLEATGATDRHVRMVVRANGAVVGIVGAVAGFLLGLAARLAYRPSLEQSAHHVIGVLALPWVVVVVSMALAVVAAYLAASRPARAVTKVTIVTALAGRPAPIAARLALRDLARYRARSGSALAAISVGVLVAVIVMLAAARYGNAFDYAGPNLTPSQLALHQNTPSGGTTVVRKPTGKAASVTHQFGGSLQPGRAGFRRGADRPGARGAAHPPRDAVGRVEREQPRAQLERLDLRGDAAAAASLRDRPAGGGPKRRHPDVPSRPVERLRPGLQLGGDTEVLRGVLGMSVGLVRSETAGDLLTLAATGAAGFTRRTLTAVTAGALGFLGALLGSVGGYVGMIGWIRDNSLNGVVAALGNVPVGDLLLILFGMPAFAAAVAWLLAGREPATMAHAAIE